MPAAQARLEQWRAAADGRPSPVVEEVRAHLDDDLDTPAAFAVIDEVAMRGHDVTEAAALLGIEL